MLGDCRAHWHNFRFCGLASDVVCKLGGGLGQVFLVDDVVAIEHGSCLVASDLHSDTFRDTGSDQIPSSSASAVMKEFSRKARALAGFFPRLAPITNGSASAVVKHVRRVDAPAPHAALDDLPERTDEWQDAAALVLRPLGIEPETVTKQVDLAPGELCDLTLSLPGVVGEIQYVCVVGR